MSLVEVLAVAGLLVGRGLGIGLLLLLAARVLSVLLLSTVLGVISLAVAGLLG